MLHPIPGLNNKNKRKFIFIHGARNNSLECQGEAEAERWEAVLKLTSPCPWKVLLGGKAQISYLEDWSVHYPLCHKYLKDFNFVIFLGRNWAGWGGGKRKLNLVLYCPILSCLLGITLSLQSPDSSAGSIQCLFESFCFFNNLYFLAIVFLCVLFPDFTVYLRLLILICLTI